MGHINAKFHFSSAGIEYMCTGKMTQTVHGDVLYNYSLCLLYK